MAAKTTSKKVTVRAAKAPARRAKAAAPRTAAAPKAPAKKAPAPRTRLSLRETLELLEKAGSAQTKKTYLRHGATEPLFGVSFATLQELRKRIGVDHDLACALWDTGNLDAKNLAVKVVDPSRMTSSDLDRWAREAPTARICGGYVAVVAAESPHALAKATEWVRSTDPMQAALAWGLVAALAMRDETLPDAWFAERLREIEREIRTATNAQREGMNQALISIGCRSAALRAAALAAAKRIGKVEIDYGDTACKQRDAAEYIAKSWAHSTSKGFDSPAAHERSRENIRLRC